jgi:large repetitive protein
MRCCRHRLAYLAVGASLALASEPAAAAVFAVTDTRDLPDAAPGDGVCASPAGPCTLRAAAMESHALIGEDHEIQLPAGTYVLSLPPADGGAGGELLLGPSAVTLVGEGADQTTIQQTVEARVMRVEATAARIVGVTLRGGRLTAPVASAIHAGPFGEGDGGGILNTGGPLALESSRVIDNEVSGSGGGVASSRDLEVYASSIEGNVARFDGGGLAVRSFAGLDLSFSTLAGNRAGRGGGLDFACDGPAYTMGITRARILGNEARSGDGRFGEGGGISYRGGPSTYGGEVQHRIRETTLEANRARRGGAIHDDGSVRSDSTLSLERSLLVGSVAVEGGGLYMGPADPRWRRIARLENTTLSGNRADRGGAAVAGSTLALRSCTLARNRADEGSGILASGRTEVQAVGTILDDEPGGGNCGGSFTLDSVGSNLESGTSCGLAGPGDQSGVNPRLEDLADNGGVTLTHALRDDSPALDAYLFSDCPDTDQRSALRPAGASCDIGAFERDAAIFEIPPRIPRSVGEVNRGQVVLTLGGEVIRVLSDRGVSIGAEEPAAGQLDVWTFPIAGGYASPDRLSVLQQGTLVLEGPPKGKRGKRRRFVAGGLALDLDWDRDGSLWLYAGSVKRRPVELLRLVGKTHRPDFGAAEAFLTKQGARILRRKLRLKSKALAAGAPFGRFEVSPVRDPDPPEAVSLDADAS